MIKYNYENWVVIVTGSARGIGKNIAEGFLKNGASVYLFDKDPINGSNTENEFLNKGFKAKFVEVDLTDHETLKGVCKKIYEKNKRIDILVNNARSQNQNNFFDEDLESWNNGLHLMLTAPFFLSREVIRYMKNSKYASIINISSIVGKLVCENFESPVYHIAKAGVLQMTRYMSIQVGSFGIRVNAVLPGFIVKDEHKERYYREDNLGYRSIPEFANPLKREGNSDDIANTVLFLSSDASSYINGQCIVVDGGVSLREQHSLMHLYNKTKVK